MDSTNVAPAAPVPGPAPAPVPAPAPGPGPAPAGPMRKVRFGAALEASRDAFGRFRKAAANNTSGIVLGLIGVAIVAFLVAYVLYWLITRYIINKKAFIVPQSKYPVVGTQYSKLDAGGIPAAGNGKRMSMSFWIYVHDIDKFKGTFRHVFHRGDQAIKDSSPSPLVFLDKDTNKLHIAFSPVTADTDIAGMQNATYYEKAVAHAKKYGITIDYIPLQRWVHVAIVVNENSSGGTILAYVDSELVKARKANDPADASGEQLNITSLQLDRSGNIWVGGSMSEEVGPGFSGLVSKVTFFNYDINAKDVYNNYMTGPIDSLLAKLGLPVYGVRSPIYKL